MQNRSEYQKLVESGYEVEKAWNVICDDSKEIGHYCNSYDTKGDFEPTGSRKVCVFCDLANVWKLLTGDPWDEAGGFWTAGGNYFVNSSNYPVVYLNHFYDLNHFYNEANNGNCVGMLSLD